jgi:hypothetical protein
MIDTRICNRICPEGSPIHKDGQCNGRECYYPEHQICCYECKFLRKGCGNKSYLNKDTYFKFLMMYKNPNQIKFIEVEN